MSNLELVIDLFKQRDELRSENERLTRKVAELYEAAEEQKQRIQSLISERDTARAAADQNWNLRREFESLLKTSDITTGIDIVKALIQGAKDNVELRKQVKEQKARIKRLEEELMDTKNEYAVLVADVVLRDDKLGRIEQLERAYAAKDDQLCNLLNICRSNGIEVSSQDLINGREGK